MKAYSVGSVLIRGNMLSKYDIDGWGGVGAAF